MFAVLERDHTNTKCVNICHSGAHRTDCVIPAGTFYSILSSLFVCLNYWSEHKLVFEQHKFKHYFLFLFYINIFMTMYSIYIKSFISRL